MVVMANDDWYAALQLPTGATTEEIAQAVEKRSRQAAALANTAPERSQQLREQTRAIKRDLLSGDEARAAYDAGRAAAANSAEAQAQAYQAAEGSYQRHQQPAYDPGYYQQPYGAPPERPYGSNRFLRFLQSGYTCARCSEGYVPGSKFCTECCAQLVANVSYVPVTTRVTNPNACPYCGTVAASIHRYCRSCGAGRPLLEG